MGLIKHVCLNMAVSSVSSDYCGHEEALETFKVNHSNSNIFLVISGPALSRDEEMKKQVVCPADSPWVNALLPHIDGFQVTLSRAAVLSRPLHGAWTAHSGLPLPGVAGWTTVKV